MRLTIPAVASPVHGCALSECGHPPPHHPLMEGGGPRQGNLTALTSPATPGDITGWPLFTEAVEHGMKRKALIGHNQ